MIGSQGNNDARIIYIYVLALVAALGLCIDVHYNYENSTDSQ